MREKRILYSLLPFFQFDYRGIYKKPNLPAKKLQRAKEVCRQPVSPAVRERRSPRRKTPLDPIDDDEIVVLLDCTLFGSSDWAILIGVKGIHFNTGEGIGFISYTEFVNEKLRGEDAVLNYDGGQWKTLWICNYQLNVSACVIPHSTLCNMFLTLR